ncbi:serralysin [Roseibium hamelinense]|uniref:Serralysin n=1 Tax=Roseibium hamelinense TaxID=150831 RepID=A0A562THE2_9HYPH|nr:M10 family metallopeptidase [Roseibium hamelinense]MTI45738.1 matrixin family metalloprotease [Roseibium hamelinense]TWI93079.1 serralysin [Roseibium hamelinense]
MTMSNTAAQSAFADANTQVFSNQQIANYLRVGYWNDTGRGQRKFDVEPGDTLTFNFQGLTSKGKAFAEKALELWSDATGINFQSSSSSRADIIFDDNDSGAYAYSTGTGDGIINQSFVNVSRSWISRDSSNDVSNYSLQTYIHEIGHALGLGHGSNYNGSATYGRDNDYANDSWQASIMSYFSQTENTYVDGSFGYVATPQIADLIAIQDLYGTPTNTRAGNTVYGDNGTAGSLMNQITQDRGAITYTIFDSGGYDTLNYSSGGSNQIIDLREGTFSSVRGRENNLIIAEGTRIENAIGGRGNDTLIANDADNTLTGGEGADTFLFFLVGEQQASQDMITDFEDGVDTIRFVNQNSNGEAAAINFDLLDIIDNGADTTIGFGGQEIVVTNVGAANLDAADFIFA